MSTIFLVAIKEELDAPLELSGNVIYTGVGKIAAAIAATQVCVKYGKRLARIINLGTAGSFDGNLKGINRCGTFIDRDYSYLTNKSTTFSFNDGLTLSTGDSFCTSIDQKNHGSITADLADMEAYAIAKPCWYFNVDFDCYKYVTDYIGVDSENDWKTRVAEGKQYFLEIIRDNIKNSV